MQRATHRDSIQLPYFYSFEHQALIVVSPDPETGYESVDPDWVAAIRWGGWAWAERLPYDYDPTAPLLQVYRPEQNFYGYVDVDTAWIASTQTAGWMPGEQLPFSYDPASCTLMVERSTDNAKRHGWSQAATLEAEHRHQYQGYVIYILLDWQHWRGDIYASLPTNEFQEPVHQVYVEDRTFVGQFSDPEEPEWHGKQGALEKAQWAIDALFLGAHCPLSQQS